VQNIWIIANQPRRRW